MNKAFVSEPEPAEPRCPGPEGCDGLGQRVSKTTLCAQLPEQLVDRLADKAYYCPTSRCAVAYFDDWGTVIPATELASPAYPKDPTAPICRCFGITAEEIQQDAEAGSRDRVRELLKKADGPEAKCETRMPSGEPCIAEVRRLFLQHFRPD